VRARFRRGRGLQFLGKSLEGKGVLFCCDCFPIGWERPGASPLCVGLRGGEGWFRNGASFMAGHWWECGLSPYLAGKVKDQVSLIRSIFPRVVGGRKCRGKVVVGEHFEGKPEAKEGKFHGEVTCGSENAAATEEIWGGKLRLTLAISCQIKETGLGKCLAITPNSKKEDTLRKRKTNGGPGGFGLPRRTPGSPAMKYLREYRKFLKEGVWALK